MTGMYAAKYDRDTCKSIPKLNNQHPILLFVIPLLQLQDNKTDKPVSFGVKLAVKTPFFFSTSTGYWLPLGATANAWTAPWFPLRAFTWNDALEWTPNCLADDITSVTRQLKLYLVTMRNFFNGLG